MPVIIGYARVSSVEQAQNSHALEQQIQRLKDASPHQIEVLSDTQSGTSLKGRTSFQSLLTRIKEQKVDEVIVTRLDRIARSVVHLREFAQLCCDRNTNLKILDQNIDLSTPHGRLMLNVLGSVAEWEVDLLKQRVNHGIKHTIENKRAFANVPFGYTKVNETPSPDLELYKDTEKTRFEIAREIIDTFLRVGTIRGTCRELEKVYGIRDPNLPKWHRGEFPRYVGLRYWLCNPILRGHLGYYYRSRDKETIVIPNNHEPLMSFSEWQEIQKNLSIVEKKRGKNNDPLPLAGLVYCGKCGSKCKVFQHTKTSKAGKRIIHRWYCSAHFLPTPTCSGAKGVRNTFLEDYTIKSLIEQAHHLTNKLTLNAIPVTTPESEELKEAKHTLSMLEPLPNNPYIEETKEKLRQQIDYLQQQNLNVDRNQKSLKEELLQTTIDPGFWEYLKNTDDLKRIFRRFINKITVVDGVITVTFNFV